MCQNIMAMAAYNLWYKKKKSDFILYSIWGGGDIFINRRVRSRDETNRKQTTR